MNVRYWLFRKGWFVIIPIVVAIVATWVWPGLNIPFFFVGESNQAFYLLSAIAQSLAAILALVFTVSLIAFQLSSRYSQRLIGQFFNKFTIIYILVFVLGISLPLWTITEANYYMVKISLNLCIVCLFLLIPYFVDLRERLSPERMLEELGRKTLKLIRGAPTERPAEIVTLDNFIMSAFGSKDYETCQIGVRILARLAYEADKEYWQRQHEKIDKDAYSNADVMMYIYRTLENIASATLDDARVAEAIAIAIWRNATRAMEAGLGDIAQIAKVHLTSIGLESIQRKNDSMTDGILSYIGSIAEEALKQNIVISSWGSQTALAESCVDDIAILSKDAIKASLPESSERAVHTLCNILESSIENKEEGSIGQCMNLLWELLGVIPYGLLLARFGRVVSGRLLRLGILFMSRKYEERAREIVRGLKKLESVYGSDFVKSGFDYIPKYWSDKRQEEVMQFRDIYDKSNVH